MLAKIRNNTSRRLMQRSALLLAAATAGATICNNVLAANGTWTFNGSTSWSDVNAWAGGVVPNASADIADFNQVDLTLDSIVTLTDSRTAGQLLFGDADISTPAGWTISDAGNSANTLTMAVASGSPTISVNTLGAGKVVTMNAILAGTQGFTKTGPGTLALTRANTYTGTTAVNRGTVTLDFTAAGAPASNIINGASTLSLNNGALVIQGANGLGTTQTVANITTGQGASSIDFVPGTGGTVGLTVTNFQSSGTPNISSSGTNTGVLRIGTLGTVTLPVLNSAVLTNGHNNPYITYGTDDWAATNGSGQVIAATYNSAGTAMAAGTLNTVTGDFSFNTVDISGLRFGDSSNHTINVNSGQTFTARSILVASTAGTSAINGAGFIRSSRSTATSNVSLNVIQNSPNDFTIGANISNASSSNSLLVKSGPGRLILTNTGNAYTSGTLINQGTIAVSNNGNLGPVATGAAVTFNGGALQATANVSLDNAGANLRGLVMNAPGGTLNVDPNFTLTVAGVVSGAGQLTKNGTGTVALNGVNTYSGGTVVNEGVLRANNTAAGSATGSGAVRVNSGAAVSGAGTIAGAMTVASGGRVIPGNSGVGTINVNALTLTSGAQLDYEFSLAGTNDLSNVFGTNALTLNGGGFNLYAEGSTSPFANAGTYPLFQYNGTIGGTGVGALSVLNPQSGRSYGFSLGTGTLSNFVVLTIGSSLTDSQWINTGGGSWSVAGNWSAGVPNGSQATARFLSAITGASTITLNGDKTVGQIFFNNGNSYTIAPGTGGSLLLDNGSSAAGINDLTGNHVIATGIVLPSSGVVATITNSGDTLTLAGDVSGGGDITKAGAGTLLLLGNNSYNNSTVNAGTLAVGAGTTSGQLGGGSVAVASGAKLAFNRSDNINVGAQISGAGDVDQNGSGVLTISGNNSYTGVTSVNSGTLLIGSSTALGSTSNLSLAGGATVDLNNSSPTVGALTGSGTVDNLSGGAATLTVNTIAGTNTFSGHIQNTSGGSTVSFAKTGGGTQILNANNTYTGATTIGGGTLQIDGGGMLSGGGSLTVAAGGRLFVNGGTVNVVTASVNNTGGAANVFMSSGSLNVTNGLTTPNGNAQGYLISVSGGTLTAGSVSLGRTGLNVSAEPAAGSTTDGIFQTGGTITINGPLSMGTNNAANSSVNVRVDSGNMTVGGPITVGLNNGGRWSTFDVNGGNVTSTDTGSGVILGGPSAGNALLLVRNGTMTAERLQFGQGAVVSTSVANLVGGQLFVGSGGMVIGSSGAGYVATVRFSGGQLGAEADFSSSIPATLNSDAKLLAADAANVPHNMTFTGAFTGAAGVVKSGTGTVTFSGANTYTGLTTVQAGNLVLTNDGTNNAQAPVLTGAGADIRGGKMTLDYLGNAANDPAADTTAFTAHFNPSGIRSSTADGFHTVGWKDDTANGKVIVAYTYAGDADLSGTVNTLDFNALASHFNNASLAVPGSPIWAEGDFNYDGKVNMLDFNAIATNFGAAAIPSDPFGGVALGTLVPEPASLGMIGLIGAALMGRRRRRA